MMMRRHPFQTVQSDSLGGMSQIDDPQVACRRQPRYVRAINRLMTRLRKAAEIGCLICWFVQSMLGQFSMPDVSFPDLNAITAVGTRSYPSGRLLMVEDDSVE